MQRHAMASVQRFPVHTRPPNSMAVIEMSTPLQSHRPRHDQALPQVRT